MLATLLAVLIVLAIRVWGLAATPWEIDEMQFLMAVEEYDVTRHQPHPPGYPLWIAAAKILAFTGVEPFRAFQLIQVLSILVGAAGIVWIIKGLGLPPAAAPLAILLTFFSPHVLIFGGTAFTDVPALCFTLAAFGALMKARTTPRLWGPAAILVAIACGIRPTAALMLAPATVVAIADLSLQRRWRSGIGLAVAVPLLCIAIWGGAVLATGTLEEFVEIQRTQSEYVERVDSWMAAQRPSIGQLWDRFLISLYSRSTPGWLLLVLSSVGLILMFARHREAALLLIASFVPVYLIHMLGLDWYFAVRYSIAWAPLFTIPAAVAAAALARSRSPVIGYAIGTAIAVALLSWSIPPLRTLRSESAPVVSALETLRDRADQPFVFVGGALGPAAALILPEGRWKHASDRLRSTTQMNGARSVLVTDFPVSNPDDVFKVTDRRLRRVLRDRGFVVNLRDITYEPHFGDGWHAPENGGGEHWRWMSESAFIEIPGWNGAGVLRLTIELAKGTKLPPRLEIVWNGSLADVIEGAGVRHQVDVPVVSTRLNRLELRTREAVVPAEMGPIDDHRRLGARLFTVQLERDDTS